MRTQPGEHLSQAGVLRARAVGQTLGPFQRVITSNLPRAIETAMVMGYAPDRFEPALSSLFNADGEVDWTEGCAAFAAAARRGGLTGAAAKLHADLLRSVAGELQDGERALLVSHGGIVELGVVGLLPDYDFSSWAPACDYCEGVRLYFEGTECTGAEILRLADLIPAS